jgi:acetyl-CoA acetyltransferase
VKHTRIKSAFVSRFGRRDDTYVSITLEAARAVLGLADVERIHDIYIASYAPRELCGLADAKGDVARLIREEFPSLRARYHGLFKTGGEALYHALEHMAESPRSDVLVVGSEKMTHVDPATAAGLLIGRENGYDARYGATLPALGALVTRAYLHTYAIPERVLHSVAVKNHRHGSLNPNAHFRTVISAEQAAESPLIADPLRRLHCAPISDGAAAVVLSRNQGHVRIIGWGKGMDTPLFQARRDIRRFLATARAGETALQRAGVARDDVDIVEIHDAFSSFELINLEDLGLYAPGTAWRALEEGELGIGGRRAVNTSGGMKAKGHPIGATGVSGCAEIVEQLEGRAGARQHPRARVGMIQSAGGVSSESYAFVLDAG